MEKSVRCGFELFTAPYKTSATSTARERSTDCSIGWHCYFYNSPQPPDHPFASAVLFLLAAFRERIKEKERMIERTREKEGEVKPGGVVGGNGVLFHPSRLPSAPSILWMLSYIPTSN